jgi:hypothetical protein
MGRRGGEMSRALEGIVRRVGLWANGGRVEESLIFRARWMARLRVVGSFEREEVAGWGGHWVDSVDLLAGFDRVVCCAWCSA